MNFFFNFVNNLEGDELSGKDADADTDTDTDTDE
jgi:hypothetical protein